jgi:DNA-binding CsgD family transcriptional regulator
MKDFEISIRVKNARLINKIKETGAASVKQFAERYDICYQSVSRCLALKITVYDKKFEVRFMPKKLGDIFNCPPTELFPESVWYEAMEVTTASVEMDEEEIKLALPYLSRGEIPALENQIFAEQIKEIGEAVLTGREKDIVDLRITGGTFDSIAEEFDLSRERIRQIEQKAFRKMREQLKRNGIDMPDAQGELI